MLSDSYFDEATGNEIIDYCYDFADKKSKHENCIRVVLARCAGCGKEIEKDAERFKFKMNWEGGPNIVRLRLYLHPACKGKMARKIFRSLVLPFRNN